MSKKKTVLIIIILSLTIIIGSAVIVPVYLTNKHHAVNTAASLKSGDKAINAYAKKYARGEELSTAVSASNGVWLLENELADADTAEENLKAVSDSVFDTVFVSTAELTSGDGIADASKLMLQSDDSGKLQPIEAYSAEYAPDDNSLNKIRQISEVLHSKSKKLVVSISVNAYNSLVEEVCKLKPDGVIFTQLEVNDEQISAARLAELYAIVKSVSAQIVVYVEIPQEWKSIDSVASSMDVMYAELSSDVERTETKLQSYSRYSYEDCVDADVFDAWCTYRNAQAEKASLPLYIGYRADLACTEKYGNHADSMLLQAVLSDNCSQLSGRVYNSYSACVADKENSMSAALNFIFHGVKLDVACRRPGAADYDGETVQTGSSTVDVTVVCSDAFPLYVNGSDYGIQEDGSTTLSFELNEGDNTIEITQNGYTLSYNVNYTIAAVSPLITFVIPSATMFADGEGTVNVTVGAHKLSEITLKLGGQKTKMKRSKKSYGQYAIFTATLNMPEASQEQRSLGKMTFTASAEGVETEVYTGAEVILKATGGGEGSTQSSTGTAQTTIISDNAAIVPSTELQTGNGSASQQWNNGDSSAENEDESPQTALDKSAVSKVCVVMAENAEIRPATPLSNTHAPTYTSLAQGTMDTITDVVEYDDGEDCIQYYVLQSGRRIKISDASVLQSCSLSDNTVSMLSGSSSNGEAQLTLSTSWRVPYNAVLTPQSYQSGYSSKQYNVSSFTAQQLKIDFYYTTAATGTADLSGSDVISGCSWSTDSASKISTLTLTLKQPGSFYGYSIGYNSDGSMYIKVSSKPKALSGSVIMIDAGHGGKDVGALSQSKSLHEADVNLSMANYLRDYLMSLGATVSMTRSGNSYVSLSNRRKQLELLNPDLFISIHCNASENLSDYGTSVFYYTPWSQPLGKSINGRLTSLFDGTLYADGTSSNKGNHFYPFSVCRETSCPSVLVETAYISNSGDCAILSDSINRQKIAEAIGNGISDYINSRS